MARYDYAHHYRGISGRDRPRGMDPNYQGDGYGGMRMHSGPGQATYGRYRMRHEREMEGVGGFQGGSLPSRAYTGEWEQGYGSYRGGPRGYDHGMHGGGGGVHDPRYDAGFMRDFNARSPLLHGQGWGQRRYGGEYRQDRAMPYDDGYRFGYANRGLSSSGYSQPWAFGRMRGSPDR